MKGKKVLSPREPTHEPANPWPWNGPTQNTSTREALTRQGFNCREDQAAEFKKEKKKKKA